mgnify:CR=1 FL=1
MKFTPTQLVAALGCTAVLALTACGGGGGGGGSASSASAVTLSVTSATGAAFVGATITVTDRTGAVVGTSSAVGTDGLSTITLSAGAAAPFVLTAKRTSADGATESLVSVVPTASATTSVNITPITTLIASRLSPTGDPTKLASEVGAGTATVTTTVANTVTDVQTILQPLITAVGAGASGDPLTGTFSTDGTGYDRLLDSVKVTIIPASATATNVEIGIKQLQTDGTQPVAVQFTNGSGQTAASSVTIPAITASDLVPSGTSAKIAAHLAQLTSCYALASTARVTGTTAASVSAPECQQAFFNNDATTYKSNGKAVSSTGAFSSLFSSSVQNVVFSQGNYEFTRGNGDIVVSYKSRTPAGNETFDTFVLRLDTADNKLKQIGNQYDYPGGISAYHQLRKFVTLNQSASDYYSTGYNFSIGHVTGGSGVDGSIFDRVEVTTPRGNTLVLKPKAGYSSLQLVKHFNNAGGSEVVSGTSFVRLNSVYADTTNAADPASRDTTLFFADRTQFTDTILAAIPAQSVWTFKYFLAGNTGATADATQHYKTRARALTIEELKTKGFSILTSSDLAYLNSNALPSSHPTAPGRIPFSAQTTATLNWTVGSTALPPTSIQIWGNYNDGTHTGSFNDSTSVGSTARTGNISCTNTGASDYHCASGNYTTTTVLSGSHLWARDTAGREYASFFAMYYLP